MKLEDALKKAIEMRGESILSSKNLVSILDDFGAFKETKPYRNVIRTFQSEGYMCNSTTLPEQDIDKLIYTIVCNTGFQEAIVKDVLIAIRGAIGRPIINRKNQSGIHRNESSTTSVPGKPLLKKHPSEQEIEQYLNSVLEVDYDSFRDRGLHLKDFGGIQYLMKAQRFDPKDWRTVSGIKYDISYEIISDKSSSGSLNLYVYDINNNIRVVKCLGIVNIDNDLSIAKGNKNFDLFISPTIVGKIVLRAESWPCDGNALEHEPIVAKYSGLLELNAPDINIHDLQILGIPYQAQKEISFFIKYDLTQEARRKSYSHLYVYASIYDKNGVLRQKGLATKNDMIRFADGRFMAFSSNEDGTDIVKIPYNGIGKIVITDELSNSILC